MCAGPGFIFRYASCFLNWTVMVKMKQQLGKMKVLRVFYRHSFSPGELLSFSSSLGLFFFIAPNSGTACLSSLSGHGELTERSYMRESKMEAD